MNWPGSLPTCLCRNLAWRSRSRRGRPWALVPPRSSSPVRKARHSSTVSLWSIRHRWLVLALSILALVGGIGLMATQGIASTPPEDQLVGDSALAAEVEERAGLGVTPTETVVAKPCG